MICNERHVSHAHHVLTRTRQGMPTCQIYFFRLPFGPPAPFALCPAPDPAASTTPCVAPPPPLRRLLANVDRSLFLSHRSGSGGGVTPGTTPLGTRFMRTFFGRFVASSAASRAGADAAATDASAVAGCCWGGGAVCKLFEIDVGSASSACKKPDSMKSRCFWAASRLVRMSDCSSESWKRSDVNIHTSHGAFHA